MNARPYLQFGSAVIALGAAIFAWHAHVRLGETESALAAAEASRIRLVAEESTAKATLRTAENEARTHRAVLDALHTASRVAPSAAVKKLPPAPPSPADLLRNDPKLQVQFLKSQRTRFGRTYGPFFRLAAIAPANAEKFTDLMVGRLEKSMDLEAIAHDRGLARNAPELVALQRQAMDDFTRDAEAALGPAAYAQFKDYERAGPAREIVERFVGAAVVNDVPMTWEQAEQFTRVVAEASSRYQSGQSASMPTIDWTQVDARAAGILSPAQLALFQHVEPIGGGASRWSSQLQQAMDAARISTSPETKAALDSLGKKGPGG